MQNSAPRAEGRVHFSKHLTCRVLLDLSEMEALFEALPPFALYAIGQVVQEGEECIAKERFLTSYGQQVALLKRGEAVEVEPFHAALSAHVKALYVMELKGGRRIIKVQEPVVQLSYHFFTFSQETATFFSQTHAHRATFWGVQFSYPQLYLNTAHNEVVESFKDLDNPNTQLFKALLTLLRRVSKPARFTARGRRVIAPFRLGEKAREWIGSHSQLEGEELIPCL